MATPPPNEAVKLAILRQQLMDKIKQDALYKQQTDRQYTGAIQPNPNWMPTKAKGGSMSTDAMRLALAKGGVAHLAIGGQGPRNWMKGVENVVDPLKQTVGFMTPDRVADQQKSIDSARRILGDNAPRATLEQMEREIQQSHRVGAINQWIDRNLGNYIRKQMATPDDPIRTYADKRHAEIEAKHASDLARAQKVVDRAQAEADPRKKENLIRQSVQMRNDADNERRLAMDHILHMPNEQIGTGQYLANGLEEPERHRQRHGGEQLGKTEAAKAWEDATDVSLGKTTVGNVLRMGSMGSMNHYVEPWMEKADPNSEVFHPTNNMHAHYLGFDHIVDILKQDLAEGRITPEQLNKVSMEQAVRRASEYNLERTKTMEETKLKRDEGLPVHKDYGDGNKWIELAFDKELPEGWSKSPSGTFTGPDGKSSIHHPNRDKLEDALKYEGDTMGHCVGGYTNKVMRGESRIYSLRDKRNEPHVTIEVTKGQPRTSYEEMNAIYDQSNKEADEKAFNTSQERQYFYQNRIKELQDALLDKKADEMPPKIQQIYGKSNKKPKKEYIPFIQDFVKGGEWSDVLTAQNAEVVPIGNNKYVSESDAKAHYEPRVKKALNFLSNHPAFKEQHAAHKQKILEDYDFDKQRELQKISGQPIYPGSTYSAPELLNAIKNPEEHISSLNEYYPSMNGWLTETEKAMAHHGDVPQVIRKAEGGNVQPSLAQMKLALGSKGTPPNIKDVGINEAINLAPKVFLPPDRGVGGMPAPGGVATRSGMPIGGIDMSQMNPGQQLMPQPQQPQQPPQGAQPPQGGLAPQGGAQGPQGPTPPMGNMLSMTPQGQALGAMGGGPKPPGMAKGGTAKSVDEMKAELKAKKAPKDTGKRVTINAEGSGGVKGIVVPRHTLDGNKKAGAVGLHEMNEARAKVYGDDHREPLNISKMAVMHKKTLADHFARPIDEQHEAEEAALNRLREAKHIGKTANTLDESEKLDTVRHEEDAQGRTHIGFASKGVAGHALYTTGKGKDTKYNVINTCAGQTEGCGGGKDAHGVVDTMKGTCFAPKAESQYAGAAVRRAAHEQAKHDPAMTNDWILAHTGSLRNAARLADKNNKRLLFRPNVVDETDVTSRHAIRHLNDQRKAEGKPPIIANSYGKTNELHDPENGYYVTHSNVGPKVKKGESIAENIGRDKARVRNTIMAADNKGDFKNEQGNKTPPKGSYMVTDVKRGSPMSKKMEAHITHAKYWTTGREEHELTPEEKAEGPEGHFGGNGKPTTPEKAHFGHTTVAGKRFDYQKQHILHPRLVNVPERKKNKNTGQMETVDHMIPTDSRFKDEEFLPKNRFKTKNGKDAGHILMTTPTESTSNIGHQTSFTHNVSDKHIEHAIANKGEYEIDKPDDQLKAAGKEYAAPKPVTIPKTWKLAEGGSINLGRHHGYSDDDFHAFPERNVAAQRHLAMRLGEDESQAKYHSPKKQVAVHKNMDTMRLELSRKK